MAPYMLRLFKSRGRLPLWILPAALGRTPPSGGLAGRPLRASAKNLLTLGKAHSTSPAVQGLFSGPGLFFPSGADPLPKGQIRRSIVGTEPASPMTL